MKHAFLLLITLISISFSLKAQPITGKQVNAIREKTAGLMINGYFKKAFTETKALKTRILASPKTKDQLPLVHDDLIKALLAAYHNKMMTKAELETELKLLVGQKVNVFVNRISTDCKVDCCNFGKTANEFVVKSDTDFNKVADLIYNIKVHESIDCSREQFENKRVDFENSTIESFEVSNTPFPYVTIQLTNSKFVKYESNGMF